jgi:hypothetical protein
MELTLGEIKPILKYIINNNKSLHERGEFPVSVQLTSLPGIGKTSLVEQIASEIGANYIKKNLSQMSDPGELCGWPIKEHYVCKNDECRWITAELIESYSKAGWEISEETRMSYAIPEWIKSIDPNKPTILNLDDINRSSTTVLAAVMELISRQEYFSWKLPPNSTVVLTANPEGGDFNVTEIDEAIKTRMLNFNIKFDKYDWAKYAEEKGYNNQAINFMLLYGDELIDRSKARQSKINARNYTMFINTISSIDDWSKPENLAFILQIASGCFLDEDDIVGGLFTTFIANKLDKLPSPEDLINKDWNDIKKTLESQLYDKDKYRADVASVITTRFINYSLLYLSQSGSKIDIIIDRILKIVDNEKLLLTEDLIFSLIKTLNKYYPGKYSKLLLNPKVAKKLI